MPQFTIPKHIFTGKGSVEESMPIIKHSGKKALIVTDPFIEKSDCFASLVGLLKKNKVSFAVFSGITGEPDDKMISLGVECCKKEKCDFFIGIGGGSPLDSAKAIAVMAVNEGKISDYNGKEFTKKAGPVIAIPTTAGTGSEATKFTIITDTEHDVKMLLKGECVLPDIAIVDEEFSMSAPKSVTAATGLDALTHVIEAYTSKKAIDMTDTFAVSAVTRIMRYLPAAYRDGEDMEARKQMALAALEGGICINNSSVTLVHGLSRPIGALFHVPHGISNAMLLKSSFLFALEGAYERFANLGRAIGVADETFGDCAAAEKFLSAVENLCNVCEVPSLEQYGIPREAFFNSITKMAKDALDSGSPGNTRKVPTEEECMAIYKKAYQNI